MVTGANWGTVPGVAKTLGPSGANLILVASNAEHLAHAAKDLETGHIDLTKVPIDPRKPQRLRIAHFL
jgi:short-subunit dehydrogenase